jgi:hypothetical protein
MSFWNGFEKQALLYSPGNAKRFNRLANKLVMNRARNLGTTVSDQAAQPGVIPRVVARVISGQWPKYRTKDLREMAQWSGAHHAFDKNVVIPKKMISILSAAKLPQSARPNIIHHELDEAELAKRHGVTKLTNYLHNEKKIFKAWFQAAKQRSLDPVMEHAATARPTWARGYASHVSPEVLLRESNRVFHEATPKTQTALKSMRDLSGEASDLKRHGLRYGDEYIPEGGKRWNKIVKKMEGTMPKPPAESVDKSLDATTDVLREAGKI